MARVFNIGVGMAIVVAEEDVEAVTKMLKDAERWEGEGDGDWEVGGEGRWG